MEAFEAEGFVEPFAELLGRARALLQPAPNEPGRGGIRICLGSTGHIMQGVRLRNDTAFFGAWIVAVENVFSDVKGEGLVRALAKARFQ